MAAGRGLSSSAPESQGEFKNLRKTRSRRGNEAELFFAPESAFSRRRLPFFNTPCPAFPPVQAKRGYGSSLAQAVKVLPRRHVQYRGIRRVRHRPPDRPECIDFFQGAAAQPSEDD